MSKLSAKQCVPCKGDIQPLEGSALTQLATQLSGWNVVDEHHLEKQFIFKDFMQALAFTLKVGELAESQGHHPDIYLSWGKVGIKTWTHKINGLTESDFILAAKIDDLQCGPPGK